MILITTPLAAAALVFLYVRLTMAVINIRRKDRISLGDQGNDSLQKAIRAHSNLTEWAPLALVLMAVLEINGAPVWLSAPFALVFVMGRFVHPQGIVDTDAFKKRVLGMQMTIFSVIGMTVVNVLWMLYRVFGGSGQ